MTTKNQASKEKKPTTKAPKKATKKKTVEAVELVKTRDGLTLPVTEAKTLNYQRVLACKISSSGDLADACQAIVNDLKDDPRSHTVASDESVHYRTLSDILGAIKVSKKALTKVGASKLPELWISLGEALALWQEHQPTADPANPPVPEVDPKVAEAEAANAAMERAKDRAEAERVHAEKLAASAAALASLSPNAEKRNSEREEREQKQHDRGEALWPFISGMSCVNTNSRPDTLKHEDCEMPISQPWTVAEHILGNDPQEVQVTCCFCGATHKLSDNFSFSMRGKDEPVTIFRIQFLWVAVRTEDGRDDYVVRKGPKQGQLKKQPLLVCSECVKVALKMSRECELQRILRPNYKPALEIIAATIIKIEAQRREENPAETTLVATVDDHTQYRRGRGDDRSSGRNGHRKDDYEE